MLTLKVTETRKMKLTEAVDEQLLWIIQSLTLAVSTIASMSASCFSSTALRVRSVQISLPHTSANNTSDLASSHQLSSGKFCLKSHKSDTALAGHVRSYFFPHQIQVVTCTGFDKENGSLLQVQCSFVL